jgi:hypothetical protein
MICVRHSPFLPDNVFTQFLSWEQFWLKTTDEAEIKTEIFRYEKGYDRNVLITNLRTDSRSKGEQISRLSFC